MDLDRLSMSGGDRVCWFAIAHGARFAAAVHHYSRATSHKSQRIATAIAKIAAATAMTTKVSMACLSAANYLSAKQLISAIASRALESLLQLTTFFKC